MRARLTKDFRFEAAHTLPSLPEGHKCRRMHGHSFKVEISIEGEVDESIGWVYDHKRISEAMRPLLEQMDHGYLNDIEGLESPTIERMAGWFWKKLAPDLPGLADGDHVDLAAELAGESHAGAGVLRLSPCCSDLVEPLPHLP